MKRLCVEEPKLTRVHLSISLFFLVIASLALGVQSKKGADRPLWPKKMGEYTATSSERIPLFPKTLSGYRSEEGKDFWGKPYSTRGTIRIFQGDG